MPSQATAFALEDSVLEVESRPTKEELAVSTMSMKTAAIGTTITLTACLH
jgi:hypothetical protein